MSITELIGKTLTRAEKHGDDEIIFETAEGTEYVMYHSQDCCESVSIEDIAGDLSDLIGSPILKAEERESTNPTEEIKAKREAEEAAKKAEQGDGYYYYGAESETWTFYELTTNKGSVTIRWYGTSNGYYSESVSFSKRADKY